MWMSMTLPWVSARAVGGGAFESNSGDPWMWRKLLKSYHGFNSLHACFSSGSAVHEEDNSECL